MAAHHEYQPPSMTLSGHGINEENVVSLHHSRHQSQVSPAFPSVARETKKPECVPTLRYRWRTICFALLYLPFVIIPWVFTAILTVRPLQFPSYYNQLGQYSPFDALRMLSAMGAVRVMNSIASVLTVPVVSALLGQAAVVYTQRRRTKQKLNLLQTFALADRSWGDALRMWKIWRGERGAHSRFLIIAALVLLLNAIQQPLQSALVASELTPIMTCLDNPVYIANFDGSCGTAGPNGAQIGYDPEPSDMLKLPQNVVTREVSRDIAGATIYDSLAYLWPEVSPKLILPTEYYTRTMMLSYYELESRNNGTFFVAALPNGTTTGVLRQHAIRLNSSVTCERIDPQAFPSPCPGPLPFDPKFDQPGNMSVSVCVPGNYTLHPWTTSRDRQDIQEEFYLDVKYNASLANLQSVLGYADTAVNFTMQCTATTSRGYFELGNYRNNYNPGPLISQWPSPNDELYNWDDYEGAAGDYAVLNASDPGSSMQLDYIAEPDEFTNALPPTPGPLTTLAIATFGNESFFHTAANSTPSTAGASLARICQPGQLPFYRIMQTRSFNSGSMCPTSTVADPSGPSNTEFLTMLSLWLYAFNSSLAASTVMETGVFFANRALLRQTVDASQALSARQISSSPGMMVLRPLVSPVGLGIVSGFMLLQIVSIVGLVVYIYRVPTWTASLNALAVAKIAASLGSEPFGVIGPAEAEDSQRLKAQDGLIGIEDDEDLETKGRVTLALGATGRITRRHVMPCKKKRRHRRAGTKPKVLV